jgi:hypothetical protein
MKKEKETLPVAGGLEACPSRPACFSRGWAVGAELASSLSLSRSRGPAQESQQPRALSIASLTSGPRMSAAPLLPLAVTEPETNTTATESNRVFRDFLPENVVLEL